MTSAEKQVKIKYPRAVCKVGGRPPFQIWDIMFQWCGDKLGEGNTEAEAWKDAAKGEL